jgi:menaquinone-9 beta-reductase
MSADLPAGDLADLEGTIWDAIVIGAGPSGAMAARRLSLAGARVLLVEKKRFPRAKVCGACLSPLALEELALAGLGSLVPSLGGRALSEFHLRFRGRLLRIPLSGGSAVSRERFDAALTTSATGAGCHFRDGTRALVDRGQDGSLHVRLTQYGHHAQAVARTVLVASGLNRSIVQADDMPLAEIARGSRVGAGCRLAPAPPSYGDGTIFMAIAAGGYVGIVRVEDGSLNVAAAFDPALIGRCRTLGAAAIEVLASAGAPQLGELEDAQWQGTAALTRRTRPLCHDRLFVLGDAAGYVEPFTGEGIAWSLASARAIEPFALRAIERWEPRLARDWARAHHELIGRRGRVCRALAHGLRHPWLTRLGFELLARLPGAASGIMRMLNLPLVYSNAS